MSRSESSREVSVTTSSVVDVVRPFAGAVDERAAVRRDQLGVGGDAHTRTAAGIRPRSSRCCEDELRALLRLVLLGVDHDLGIARLLVRIVDTGEALDLALERLLVETLDVAARALLDRRGDVAPRRTCPTPRRARAPSAASPRTARSPPRSPRRRVGSGATATQPMRSMFVSRSSFEKPRPFDRCVRTVSPSRYSTIGPRSSSCGTDEVGDRRLAGTGQPGEPEREAAVARALRLRVLVRVDVLGHSPPSLVACSPWMPHSSLSEPAQRPARSSSPAIDGRVHGMQPIERIARVVQRVVGNLVDVDVGPDALLVPVGERVDLPDAVALRPLDRLASARGSATGRGGCR